GMCVNKKGIFSDTVDHALLIYVIITSILGIVAINSAAANLDGHYRFVIVQSAAFILGMAAMTALTFFNYTYLYKLRFVFFGAAVVMLAAVLVIGKVRGGTQGWIAVGPVNLQPAEIAKVCFIITLSCHLSAVKDSINKPGTLLLLLLHLGVYVGLILMQPDFGTAMVFVVIFFVCVFFAGISLKYIFGALGAVAAVSPVLWFLLKPHQRNRILSFFNPESDPTGTGYHVLQSKLAIGSGQILGRGYLKGPQTQYGYLPERQTDFIFSSIGEEFGFIGCAVITILLFSIIVRCFKDAADSEHEPLGMFICAGVGAMMFFHTFENIGMCLGIMPITGIPLPFVSYGGSSMLTCCAAVGLVQSVVTRRRRTKFNI
ncbi:MAG: rod shape-determining protein RodA, partial [Clostridia bacterium]